MLSISFTNKSLVCYSKYNVNIVHNDLKKRSRFNYNVVNYFNFDIKYFNFL